ncbi:MAG: NUDIX domain-containing protein [bacterium]
MKIPIVDEEDNIIGHKEREEITSDDIYRITAIWITDENGNILLQKRSMNRKNSPGIWGPAASGTVEEGETYESNAYKELEEEIGVKGIKLVESKKFFRNLKNGKKFTKLFLGQIPSNYNFVLQQEEVDQVKWLSVKELLEAYKEKPDEYANFIEVLIDFLGYK